MARHEVVIHRAGLVTAVGLGVEQTCAAVKAGVAGFADSSIYNAHFDPIVMATLPEEYLPPLAPDLQEVTGLTSRQRRLLQLLTPALEEVLVGLDKQGATDRIPLFLATPEKHPDLDEPVAPGFLDQLVAQIAPEGLSFDLSRSVILPKGRAGGLLAVKQAQDFLATGGGDYALAGGVDSCLDLMLLATLDRDQRIQCAQVMDGFIPGEGAGILLLGRPGAAPLPGLSSLAQLVGVGVGLEPGHRYSEEPYLGEGLSTAFRDILTRRGALRQPVPTIFAGLNGENFGAKEFGVAVSRSNQELTPDALILHPADCFGDIGAALGPVMLGVAATGLGDKTYTAPGLVWSSSDGPERAAALVDIVIA